MQQEAPFGELVCHKQHSKDPVSLSYLYPISNWRIHRA
ncbi:hypothetical protein ECSTECMHI813_1070 [Escherichia coli STEC_MHI813]|nr:hypothetical protein ECSTECMHI813_1070 [Escherichia coli STEC_MHI813]